HSDCLRRGDNRPEEQRSDYRYCTKIANSAETRDEKGRNFLSRQPKTYAANALGVVVESGVLEAKRQNIHLVDIPKDSSVSQTKVDGTQVSAHARQRRSRCLTRSPAKRDRGFGMTCCGGWGSRGGRLESDHIRLIC